MENKREIMAQIVALLSQLIENESDTRKDKPPEHSAEPVEMLTIKECTQAVSGLSEHTVRQLVAQHKIPYIRTGQGKRGKILISKTALLEYLGGAAVVKRLVEALKLCCFSEPIIPKEDEIHMLNGILKTDGTWLEEILFCTNRLNVNYDPEIWNRVYYPEDFLLFLSDMLEMEDITTLQEFLGYCLIPSTKGQAMLFIIGNGGEGKSRIGIVLQGIFKSAMITGNFQRIETDKFFRYNLQNKLLMLDDDMQMNALSSTGYIKNLITAEIPVDVEAKGQQSQQAMLYSRFLCFGNGSPKALYDKSDGFTMRMIILTTKPVPENRRNDPFLAEKLIAEKEKIFCWMFDGLRRLIRNNFRFTISEKTRRNIAEIMSDNCNSPEFLEDRSYISFGSGYSESTQALYSAYVDWCHKNLMNILNQNTFSTWLRSNSAKWGMTATNHITVDNREVRGYKGVKTHFRSIIL